MRRAKGRGKRADMGMLVAETATRLRSGATPEGAWRQTLERAGLGAHADLDADGVPAALRKLWLAPRWRRTVGEEVRLGVPPAIAVCRMSKLTGAPTADVLESCAAGITEAGEQWTIPIMGGHTLVVGMTGAGKGSVLGGIAVGMTPQIQARRIKMYGIDLKGGVEQEAYKQIFEKRARTYAEAADLLTEINALLFGERESFLTGH